MNTKAQGYAVSVVLLFLAIFLVLFIELVYPSERQKMLSYSSEENIAYYSVKITEGGFYPAELEVLRGARVSWINHDNSLHTIKFLDSKSNIIPKGGSYSKVFGEEGVYSYTSDYKPGFSGTIKVS